MTAAAKILERLTGVKQTAPGRWMAICPAHEDRSPSLSIREMDDGRVLIYCFASCGAGDVLAAIGLRMGDLFDKPLSHHLPPIRGGLNARELLELSAHEATVALLLACDAQKRQLTAGECERLSQAAARLQMAQDLAHGR
jgi:hypothetical protein